MAFQKSFWLGLAGSLGLACGPSLPPIQTVNHVDLKRFMGDWYVIANIPTFLEKGAHNAIESYRLDEDGRIRTTFTFRDGSFDGERKEYNPVATVKDSRSNAIWGMQFIWPIKADYRIVYLDKDYSLTVIGRQARDYVWIMARTPVISESDYTRVLNLLVDQGYDISQIQRVPQRWHAGSSAERS
jgi:apolipoprotein D and lipocalin family protein